MTQAKPVTIRKLRAEKLYLLDALVKAWYAAGLSDDEVVQKVREEFTEAPSLGEAVMKAFQNPSPAGMTVSSGNHPPVGAGTWTPDLAKAADSDPRVQKRRDKIAAEAERLEKTRRHLRERRIDR